MHLLSAFALIMEQTYGINETRCLRSECLYFFGWVLSIIEYCWANANYCFRLCSRHRKEFQVVSDDISMYPVSIGSCITIESEYKIDDCRQLINHILNEVNLSPIRSQTRKNLLRAYQK